MINYLYINRLDVIVVYDIELLWDASVDEIKQGYVRGESGYTCLLCGRFVEAGVVYPLEGMLYEAQRFMEKHIDQDHGSVFSFLVAQEKRYTGLSEHQGRLMELFYQGKTDAEVQDLMGIGSISTVRNHRHQLREKERQAKSFLVLMELMRDKAQPGAFTGRTAQTIDPGAAVDEEQRLLEKYFPQGVTGPLKTFAMQQKHKRVVLKAVARRFEEGRSYTEQEVNDILSAVYAKDPVEVRRYLIDLGLMERKPDGSSYRLRPASGQAAAKTVVSGVYQVRNTVNQKIYVTSERNIAKLNGIRFELNMGTYRNKGLQGEWKQYGEGAFVFEILESFEEDAEPAVISKTLKKLEKKWIARLQPFGDKGYNKP